MMDYPKSENLAVVFVGCGGTFWHSANFFTYLLKALQPEEVHFIDPDLLEPRNTERQWCNFTGAAQQYKAEISDMFFPGDVQGLPQCHNKKFQEWGGCLQPTRNVLLIVNVDNDEARLAIREWAMQHRGMVAMVMSGCDTNYGQVYYGIYGLDGAWHDWQPLHTDVGNKEEALQKNDGGCGAQSAASNMLTGSLFAPAVAEAMMWLNGGVPEKVGEWYWRYDTGKKTVKMWTQTVVPFQVEPEEVL